MPGSYANSIPSVCWRQKTAALAVVGLLASLALKASADPARLAAAALDIAAAVREDAAKLVEPAAYNQATEPADEGAAAPMPPDSPAEAEEVQPREQPAVRRRFRPITELTIDATLPEGLLPAEVEPEPGQPQPEPMPKVGDLRLAGGWGDNLYLWSATGLCHGPLYFEEVNLERYGYQCHPAVQPLLSGAHFFLTVPTLPYQMTVHPPRECIYTLGHYRPGSRVPWQRHRLPCDARAAAVQAGVTVGLVFLIP